MAQVPASPARHRSLDADRRQARAAIAQLDRKREPAPIIIPFVRVSPWPVEAWPVGTAWLNTTIVGPFGAHPLSVKREGGVWDQVAWLVPAT